jgi:Phosphotransferase enzyme family
MENEEDLSFGFSIFVVKNTMTSNYLISHRLKALPRKVINFVYGRIPRRIDPQIIPAAERVLSLATGSSIQLTRVERLSEGGRRNLLLRCHTSSASGLPPSLIIKKVEAKSYDLEDSNSYIAMRFFNDWVGAQFLSAILSPFNHSPHFYGGDRTLGFIILENVQHRARLVESLLGQDRTQAERGLLQYAACLGQLHTDTIGKATEFQELFQAIAPNLKRHRISVDIPKHQRMLERVDIYPESNWLQDLQAIERTVSHPGEFLTYIHADACPDNVLDTGEGLRLIDFETGHFGHALIDAAYGRMMFPNCWCANRLPDNVVQQMETIYRTILIQRCPIAEDDRIFETALVNACGFWLLHTLARHFEYALEKDFSWGISTIRQRILARLEAFITTAQEFNQLPGLCSVSSRLLDKLHQCWSNTPRLPLYPSLR